MDEWLPRSGMVDALADCHSRFPGLRVPADVTWTRCTLIIRLRYEGMLYAGYHCGPSLNVGDSETAASASM